MSFSQTKNIERFYTKPYLVIPIFAAMFILSIILPSLIKPSTTSIQIHNTIKVIGTYHNGTLYINITNYSEKEVIIKKIVINDTIELDVLKPKIPPGKTTIIEYPIKIKHSNITFGEIIVLRVIYECNGVEYTRSTFIIVK
ncbi:hypothetical protein J4526_00010 [Desulfurococcaceae archaeon MEX13E-LK6-19]|nr:hypothetical protein J4526_00010 [Desulfurococcaceae archaeon MEX13E-LK6-19]